MSPVQHDFPGVPAAPTKLSLTMQVKVSYGVGQPGEVVIKTHTLR